jgi:CDP-glycerol glycerophosphotransferase (TagB/SpsB family)
LRSKYVFFTHGLFGGSRISKQHCVVNLWHGMPLKKIGLLGNTEVVQNSKYAIATSIFYQEIMASALGVEKQNVLIVGQPRNDLMFKNNNCLEKLGLLNNKGDKIILWTPTFRQSVIGDIRVDGLSTNDFPVIKSSELVKLNEFLSSIKSFMIIKLHPMDILNNNVFNNYSNIRIIKKDELEFYNCQLYSLLGKIDILLTDFSSIYIDYLLLNRPIGFVVDDLSEYSNSRGFIFDHPEKYMPGKKISTLDELKDFLYSSIVLKEKFFLNEHNQVNMKFNKVFSSYSNELLKAINFK